MPPLTVSGTEDRARDFDGVGIYDFLRGISRPTETVLDRYTSGDRRATQPWSRGPMSGRSAMMSPDRTSLPSPVTAVTAADAREPTVGAAEDDRFDTQPARAAANGMGIGGYYDAIRAGAEEADSGYPEFRMSDEASRPAERTSEPEVSPIQQYIDQLSRDSTVSSEDRALALAQAGFGMAASRSPYFFGSVGEGGLAGLSAYRDAKQRAAANASRAAGLILTEQQRRETNRSNAARETLEAGRLTEAERSNRAQEEAARRRDQDTRDYREAVTGQGRWTVVGTTKEGRPILLDGRSSSESPVTKVVDVEVGTLGRGGGGGESATAIRERLYRASGYEGAELADRVSGKKPTTRAEAEKIAIQAGRAKSANEAGQRARDAYNDAYNETLRVLGFGPGGATPATPGAPGAAPSTGRPPLSSFGR